MLSCYNNSVGKNRGTGPGYETIVGYNTYEGGLTMSRLKELRKYINTVLAEMPDEDDRICTEFGLTEE